MKNFRIFIAGLAVLLVFLFFQFFKSDFSSFLKNGRFFLLSFSERVDNYSELEKLRLENLSLKNELQSTLKEPLDLDNRYKLLQAQIYSFYPFNDRGSVIIALGSEDGLREGMPILVSKGTILGLIKEIKRTQSEVMTIFDQGFKISVSIGEKEIHAVLEGGTSPVIKLIPKDSGIKEGDKISNLSPDLPINFLLGIIKEINEDGETWLSARVETPYSLSGLDRVLVMTNFP